MSEAQKFPPDEEVRKGVTDSLGYWVSKLECGGDAEKQWHFKRKFIERLRQSPIAEQTDLANEQHYEVPTEYYIAVLGERRKYSCCYWPEGVTTLEEAEDASLALICERARVEDGQSIMDLGCGWGALSLYICEKFPTCKVTSVSNSRTQRELIESKAQERGFGARLDVITADANTFVTANRYDRIISIEMFEHMRNYELLLQRVSTWLKPHGLLFTQILCHREFTYAFDTKMGADTEWMARHFFSGGTMPSADLFLYFQNDVAVVDHWRLNGKHYTKTLEAWLARLDQNRDKVASILDRAYGASDGPQQLYNWRMFFMFCSEVFAHREGNEWIVAYHLFKKRS